MTNSTKLYYPRHERLWEKIQPETEDLAHDTEHVLRVYRWAVRLAAEVGADPDLAGAAALLHDAVNVPKESDQRTMAAELSAIKGAEILPAASYSDTEIEEIVGAIRTCSWSKGLTATSKLGEVLQDADRLDAIGAIGIMRNMACAQAMASRGNAGQLYHSEDPFGKDRATLDDKQYAIDHFSIKLLKLTQSMNTAVAKKEAQRRHRFMLQFLFELAQEI